MGLSRSVNRWARHLAMAFKGKGLFLRVLKAPLAPYIKIHFFPSARGHHYSPDSPVHPSTRPLQGLLLTELAKQVLTLALGFQVFPQPHLI